MKQVKKFKRTVVVEEVFCEMQTEIANIYELRKSKKLKQEEMSKILGISRPAYCAIEKGTTDLRLKHLKAICEHFNLTSKEILGF